MGDWNGTLNLILKNTFPMKFRDFHSILPKFIGIFKQTDKLMIIYDFECIKITKKGRYSCFKTLRKTDTRGMRKE